MNKVFKVIWNHSSQTWTVVSELGKSKTKSHTDKRKTLLALAIGALALSEVGLAAQHVTPEGHGITSSAAANGEGASVIAGANITYQGNYSDNGGNTPYSNTIVGRDIKADGNNVLVGNNITTPGGSRSVVVGSDVNISKRAINQETNVIVLGHNITADTTETVYIGENLRGKVASLADGTPQDQGPNRSVAIGYDIESGFHSVGIGTNVGTGAQTVTVGDNATASSTGSIAIGQLSKADARINGGQGAYPATAIGKNSNASNQFASAIGSNSSASGDSASALGHNSTASGRASTALGFKAQSTGNDSIAAGRESSASEANTVAVGYKSNASKESASAVGTWSEASGDRSSAFGRDAKAREANATAVGSYSQATGVNSTTLGAYSRATADNSTALGEAAIVSIANSVALGAGSKTDASGVDTNDATVNNLHYEGFKGKTPSSVGVVSVGSKGQERQIKNIAAGQITENSTDAINGSQLYSVAHTLGNTAGSLKDLMGTNAVLNPNGTVTTSDIGKTGKSNVYDAILEVNTIVAAGKNTAVTQSKDGEGRRLFTVDAWNTTVATDTPEIVNVVKSEDAASKESTYKINVNKESLKGELTAENGKAKTSDTEQKFATTTDVMTAINSSGFKATIGKETADIADQAGKDEHLITPGNSLTLKAGKNLIVAQKEANITFATSNEVDFDQVTVGDVVINKNDGINAGNKKISNVAEGELASGSKDAVNGSQLYQTNWNVSNLTTKIGEGLKFTGNNAASVIKKDLGETLEIVGGVKDSSTVTDKNTYVSSENNKLVVKFADRPEFTGVQLKNGSNVVNLNAENGKLALSDGNNAAVKLGNVEAGTDANDAVNVSQLKANTSKVVAGTNIASVDKAESADGITYTVNAKGSKVSGSSSIKVTPKSENDNVTDYTVELSDAAKESLDKATSSLQSWIAQIDGTQVKEVNKDDNVLNLKKGDNIDITNDNGSIKISTAKSVDFDNVNVGGVVINKDTGINAGNKAITNVAGNLDGAKAGTTAPGTSAVQPKDIVSSNAATVGDVLNAGWNLQANGQAKDFVTAYDTVNFVNGTGTDVTIDSQNGVSKVAINVNLSKLIDGNVGNITTEGGKTVVDEGDKGKLVTTDQVSEAINASGFKATIGKETADIADQAGKKEHLITPGNSLTLKAGKNLIVAQKEANITFATSNEVDFDQVTVGDVVINKNDGINAGNKKISNVAEGELASGSKDAVNGSQLYQTNWNVSNLTTKIGEGLKFTGNNAASVIKKDLGETLEIVGGVKDSSTVTDKNTYVSSENNKLVVKFADRPEFTGVQLKNGSNVVNLNAETGKLTLSDGNNAAVKLGNVEAGTDANDAVNVSQLKANTSKVVAGTNIASVDKAVSADGITYTVNAKGSKVSGSSSIKVTPKSENDNVTDYTVELSDAAKESLDKATSSLQSWIAQIDGTQVKEVNKDDNVLNLKKGDNIDITNDNGSIKISTAKSVDFDNVDVGGVVINKDTGINAGNKAITNVAGNLDGAKAGTTAPGTSAVQPKDIVSSNAATVGDVLNAGWNLQANGQAKDFVTAYDTVNFVNGTGTDVTIDSQNGVSKVAINVNLSKLIDGNVGNITTEGGKTVVDEGDKGKLVTTDQVSEAINASGFKATIGKETADIADQAGKKEHLITPGNSLTLKAGKNLIVAQKEANITFATSNEVDFDQVTVGDVVINKNDGINAGNKKISNVAEGELASGSKDAVNGSQLYQTNWNVSNLTTKIGEGLKFTGNNAASVIKKDLGETLEIVGGVKDSSTVTDKNTYVSSENNKLVVKFADRPEFTGVQLKNGSNVVNLNAETGKLTLSDGNNAAVKLGNVEAGTDANDAVNVSQLKANTSKVVAGTNIASVDKAVSADGITYTVNAKGSKVSGSSSIKVTPKSENDNVTDYTVELSDAAKESLDKATSSLQSWIAQIDGTQVKEVNKDDNVLNLKKGDNIDITNDNGSIKISTAKSVDFDNVDVGGVVINKDTGINAGNKAITNVAGNLDGAKAGTTAPGTSAVQPKDIVSSNAATVGDVLNAGWNLQANGQAKDFVTAYDTVNFVNGTGTDVTIDSQNGVSKVAINVNLSKLIDGNVGNITTEGGKTVVDEGDKGKLVTTDQVSEAINASGFKATIGKETADIADQAGKKEHLITPGNSLTLKAGKNLIVAQKEANITFATSNEVDFDQVTVGDVVINKNDGINAGNKKISNVAEGELASGSKDAVNGSQLYQTNWNVSNLTTKIGEGLKFTGNNAASVIKKDLGETLEIVGGVKDSSTVTDKNTYVSSENNKLVVKFADRPEFTGVQLKNGSNVVNLNAETGKLTLSDGNNAAVKLGNVEAGTDANDAVNVSQLKANTSKVVAGTNIASVDKAVSADGITYTVNAKGSKVSGSSSIKVTPKSENDNVTDYTVELSDAAKESLDKATSSLQSWIAQIDGTQVKEVNKDDNVLNLKKGDNIDITNDNGSIKISTAKSVDFDNVDVGGVVINKDTGINAGNKAITNVAGNLDGAKAGTTAPGTSAVQPKDIVSSNAATVGDVLNAGWNLQANGQAKDFVTAYDTVNFVNGTGTDVTIDSQNGVSKVAINVNLSKLIDGNVGNITTEGGKTVVDEGDKGKLVTTDQVSEAINASGFKATIGRDNDTFEDQVGKSEEFIRPGDILSFNAGQNLKVKQNGKNITFGVADVSEFGEKAQDGKSGSDGKVSVNGKDGASVVLNGKDGSIGFNGKDGTSLDLKSDNGQSDLFSAKGNDGKAGESKTRLVYHVKDANNNLVKEQVATLNDGLRFDGDDGKEVKRPLNSKLSIKGGQTDKTKLSDNKNIGVIADPETGSLNIKLAKNIDLGKDSSIKAGYLETDSINAGGVVINNQGINVGNKTIKGVKDGVQADEAVNRGQLDRGLSTVNNRVNKIDKDLRAGIAGAMASAGLYQVTLPGKSMISAGAASYRGQGGLALGYSRLSDNGKVGFKASVNTNSRGDTGVAASMGFQW